MASKKVKKDDDDLKTKTRPEKLWDVFDEKITKEYGLGTIMDENTILDVEKTPTGILSLDVALGGGVGDGRFLEILGWESSGKTTVATHIMVSYQEKYKDKAVGVIDYENAFDKGYAKNLGLDTSKYRWRISQPDNAEQGMDVLGSMIESDLFSCIVIDSIAAMSPIAEVEGNIEDQSIGKVAKMMSKVCRKYVKLAMKHNTTIIWINQYREKVGVSYGSPNTTPGGNAMKFFASQRLNIAKKYMQDKTEMAFSEVEVIKNKIAAPFKKASLFLVYGKGVDKTSDLLDVCEMIGLVNRSGAWYSLNDEDKSKIGQGRNATIELLNDNIELCKTLKKNAELFLLENNYTIKN